MAREALAVIIRLAGQAPSRRQPLSSNVRPHQHRQSASELHTEAYLTITRRTLLSAAILPPLLSACVSTRVTGQSLAKTAQPAQQLLVVVASGRFSAGNTASNLGQQNLDSLVPNLVERLPAVFSRNGVPSRGVNASSPENSTPGQLRPAAGERVLVVAPQSATYNSRSGQELFVSVKLLSDPPALTTVWQGQVRMGTLGFGKFDAKVANDIAIQILELLRSEKLATVREGALQVE